MPWQLPDAGLFTGEHRAGAAKAHGDFVVDQVHAATAEEADAQAAKALLEKALAYYQTNT